MNEEEIKEFRAASDKLFDEFSEYYPIFLGVTTLTEDFKSKTLCININIDADHVPFQIPDSYDGYKIRICKTKQPKLAMTPEPF